MKDLLTPKQVARAIGVSESSVKRWCDSGAIPARYTAGGHRRIPLNGLLEFLRVGKHRLVRPEVLGLPTTLGQSPACLDSAREALIEALLSGGEEVCRRIMFDLYMAEHSLATIGDQVLAPAFRDIGCRWECGSAEVYQERLSCGIMLRVLHELRRLIPDPPEDAPIAIGGTPAGDDYHLATTMVELVLSDLKWKAVSLGNNLPFVTLAAAIREHRPRLFWLSCSHIADPDVFLRGYGDLHEEYGMAVPFAVGGQGLTDRIRHRMRYSAYCDTLQHLESFALTLRYQSGSMSE